MSTILSAICSTAAAAVADSSQTRSPLIIAHRGGRRWAPENTLAAFKRSVDAHVDGIELDIHRCKTGELIVIHDETLQRTTNGAGLVKDKTLAELKSLDAGSWYKPEFKDERLPLLSEVLDLVDGKCSVNVEIKDTPIAYPGIDDALIELLSHYKYPEKIIVSSFDHAILKSFHAKAPQYKVGFLDAAIPASIGEYAQIVGATAWNPDYEVLRTDAVTDAHAAGLKIFTWTVNKPEEWNKLNKMGVDGIITDDPVGAIEALRK
ncbi:MAG TPA: glycerophosphodiester phosphodiesterase [Candidatus Obscuribacterales bacterium]